MSLLSLANVVLYSLQLAVVVGSGFAAASLLRIRSPRLLLTHDYALLVVGAVLPLLTIAAPHSIHDLPVVARFAVDAQGSVGPAGRAAGARVLAAVWLAGAAAQAGLLAMSIVRLRTLRRRAGLVTAPPPAIDEMERRLATSATWMVSDAVTGPATYGVIAPIVLLPRHVLAGDPSVLRMAICHELVHVRRRDWLAVVAEELVRAVLWFHPCVWWVLSRIRLHREQLVDERVVATLGGRDEYARALVDGAAREITLQTGIAPAWTHARQLRARVIAIREGAIMSRSRVVGTALLSAMAMAASAWWVVRTFPVQASLSAAAQADDRIYSRSDGISMPTPISSLRPEYTPGAMKAKIEGYVGLAAIVKADGATGGVVVTHSLDTQYGLDERAVEALRQARWKPGTKDGKPVNVRIEVNMRFTLK